MCMCVHPKAIKLVCDDYYYLICMPSARKNKVYVAMLANIFIA